MSIDSRELWNVFSICEMKNTICEMHSRIVKWDCNMGAMRCKILANSEMRLQSENKFILDFKCEMNP